MLLCCVARAFTRKHLAKQSAAVLPKAMGPQSSDSRQVGKFYIHQESLPRLPVPPLKQTLDKYLKTVSVLVNDEQFENTKKLVEDFGAEKGYGEHLHEKLLEHAKTKENWLSDWWLDAAYLESNASVVIYCSPSVSFPKYQFSGTKGQIEHAAKVIAGMLQYKAYVDNEALPIEKMGKNDLCMDQYYRIFSSCRIPGIYKDATHCYARTWRPPSHITVIHNNQFFELCVYHSDGSPFTIKQLETQLSRIVADSPTAASTPVGILTSRDRRSWGRTYQILSQDRENRESLQSIERSIFAVCLDQETPPVAEENWRSDASARLLHGGGSRWNTGNRWFDKTIQMVIDKSGGVGIAYEHSPAEGPPVASLMDYVYEFCDKVPSQPESSVMSLSPPKQLKFNVSEEALQDIKEGEKEIDALIDSLNLTVFDYADFGKDLIKSMKLSPDAFIQLALQVAYYRRHEKPPATYESASLRQFRLGRTDTIRSSSILSHAFSVAMTEKNKSPKEVAQLLRDAATAHKQYTNDAINGQAVDRHLLGLRIIAQKSGQDIPLLFQDETYKKAMSFNLSTSQVPCKADLSMAFGPAVADGYGICYNPKNKHILFSVSSYKAIPEYDVESYRKELSRALSDMRDVLVSDTSKL